MSLASRDLDETFTFYERLGFERRPESPATDADLIVGRGEIQLEFRDVPGLDPFSNRATTYIRVPYPDPSSIRNGRRSGYPSIALRAAG